MRMLITLFDVLVLKMHIYHVLWVIMLKKFYIPRFVILTYDPYSIA